MDSAITVELFNAKQQLLTSFSIKGLSSSEIVSKLEKYGIKPDLDINGNYIPENVIPRALLDIP